MVSLYVYKRNVGLIGEISDYESIEFTRNYYEVSKVVLRVAKSKVNAELLQKGNFFAETTNYQYAYIIDHFSSITENGVELIEVYAFSMNYILSFRTIPKQIVASGTIENVIKEIVRRNAIEPDDPNRIIEGLTLAPNNNIPISIRATRTGGDVLENSFEILKASECSLDILYDVENNTFELNVWRGEDRSIEQANNTHVMFSVDYDNVLQQTYYNSDMDLKNFAYIAGEGEGVARQVESVGDSSGWERREVYVDARDLQSTYSDENGMQQELDPQEYRDNLISRGIQNLSEKNTVESFEAIVDDVQYILGRDYRLGDKVTFFDKDLNLVKSVRVTSITKLVNKDGITITPSFGTGTPNKLINKEV